MWLNPSHAHAEQSMYGLSHTSTPVNVLTTAVQPCSMDTETSKFVICRRL